MEYRIDGGELVLYSADSEPDLEGTHVVEVRYAKTEEHTAGKITTLIFYKNRQETKADLTVDVKTNQESVTVSGNTSAETVSVVAEAANGAAYENIVFIKEVKASENSFTVEFLMPEGAGRGEYMINAGIPGLSERVKKEFYYVPGDIIAAFINEIKNADEQGIESLLLSQENKDILECLGIDTEKLYKIEDMSALAARLSEDKDKLDEQLLAEYAAVYTAFALIEQCASAAEVIEVIDEFNDDYLKLSFEEKGWQEIEDNALKAWLGDYLKGKEIDSPERMAEEYEAANILYLINTSSYVSIEEVITRYAQELGISSLSAYNRYLGLSDSAREDKNKDIKLKCDYHSVLDFKNEFTDIMSGSSGGSGGSGGCSGSGNNSGTGNNYITYNEQSSGIPNNVAPKEIFSDLDEAQWAKEEIEKLYELGVVSGMGDGRFEPNSPVTREQFAKMAVDAFGITGIGEPESFSDVPEDRWSYPYISVMRSNGLIAGYEDGSFKPDAEISREDIAVIICRVCDSVGIELGQTGNGEEFSDADEISGYAKESILRLNAAGIMSGMGDNTIAPKATATRAMAAKIICMVMEER